MSNQYNPLENSSEFMNETTPDSFTNRASGIFTQQPQSSYSSGNTSTNNPALDQGISSGIGAAAQVGSSIIQGVATSNENEKNRNTAREQADQARNDNLKQQNISNSMRRKQQEIEQKNLLLQKKKEDYDLKINTFLYNIKKDQENKQSLTTNVDNLFGSMVQNEQIKNLIVGFAKGNV